jgi:hypothetical protein
MELLDIHENEVNVRHAHRWKKKLLPKISDPIRNEKGKDTKRKETCIVYFNAYRYKTPFRVPVLPLV